MCGAELVIIDQPSGDMAPDELCRFLLPGSDIHSISLLGATWHVQVSYDNLLHDGDGASEDEAVRNAIKEIVSAVIVLTSHAEMGRQ